MHKERKNVMKCKSCSKPVYHGIDAIIGNETVCISDCLPMYEKALSSKRSRDMMTICPKVAGCPLYHRTEGCLWELVGEKCQMQTGNDTNYALALAKAILGCKSIWGSLIIRPWEEQRIIELAQRVKEIEERDSGPA